MVCGVFQLAVVKVRLAPAETVILPLPSITAVLTMTFWVGLQGRLTARLPVLPFLMTRPVAGLTTRLSGVPSSLPTIVAFGMGLLSVNGPPGPGKERGAGAPRSGLATGGRTGRPTTPGRSGAACR